MSLPSSARLRSRIRRRSINHEAQSQIVHRIEASQGLCPKVSVSKVSVPKVAVPKVAVPKVHQEGHYSPERNRHAQEDCHNEKGRPTESDSLA
jgi:hypothetical protein